MSAIHRRSILSGLATIAALPLAQRSHAQVPAVRTNVEVIREVYRVAEANSLDADRFVSLFADDGYFLDMASGEKWIGKKVREPVSGLIDTFPDMHRELLTFHSTAADIVVVELRLQGTQKGDLRVPGAIFPATGRTYNEPCCDVFRLKDGKVKEFRCYNALSTKIGQLHSLGRLGGA